MRKIIFNKLDKLVIGQFKKVVFPGRIIEVLTPAEAERAVDYLLTQPVIGFDTETRPSFHKGQHFKCALLQVSSHDICFLFRLNIMGGLAPAIIRLLEDKSTIKVALAWSNDSISLHELGEFKMGTFIDLQNKVKEIGIEDQSLMKIYANLFKERISKSERLSNWERKELSRAQKSYAAIDAWACIRIYEEVEHLKNTGCFELVMQEEPTAE